MRDSSATGVDSSSERTPKELLHELRVERIYWRLNALSAVPAECGGVAGEMVRCKRIRHADAGFAPDAFR